MPPSGSGGQTLGHGEHGTGAGAPQGGQDGSQQGGHIPPPPPPPDGEQLLRFLDIPIVMFANLNGKAAGQQFGTGKHMHAERP